MSNLSLITKSVNKKVGRLGLGRKERFGRENFNLTKAVNGTYFRLLLSTLSSSGNWFNMFNKLNQVSSNIRSSRLLKIRRDAIYLPFKSFCSFERRTSSKLKFARIARAILSTEGVIVEKAPKARLTQHEAATIIRQYQLGRSTRFKFSRLIIRKFNSFKNKVDYKIRSWRVVHSLIDPVSLFVEIKSKRRGGRVFSVPVPIKSIKRRHSVFVHWIKKTIKEADGSSVTARLTGEFADLILKKGKSTAQLVALERSIKLNRVFLRKSQVSLV